MINIYKHILSNILHIEGEAGDYCVDMPYINLGAPQSCIYIGRNANVCLYPTLAKVMFCLIFHRLTAWFKSKSQLKS